MLCFTSAMKILLTSTFFLFLTSIVLAECPDATNAEYSIDKDSIEVGWVGFKFTNKTGVPGKFSRFEADLPESAESLTELLQGVKFEIDTLSVDSGDPIRDKSLREALFGIIADGGKISGKVAKIDGNEAYVALTMNGVERSVPLSFSVNEDGLLEAEGTIDMLDFAMNDAFASIHKRCELLHTGTDGVSKTWTVVDLKLQAKVLENCK